MGFDSKNMNYIFNIEYFKDIESELLKDSVSEEVNKKIMENNRELENFSFAGSDMPVAGLEKASYESGFSYHSFRLYTQYPGLLMGLGYPHETKLDGAVKCGFMFDYVTGMPYISGSTLKGMLRSLFAVDAVECELAQEYETYIRGLLNREDRFNLRGLRDNIFENNDIFLGAYPDVEGNTGGILKMDYITPHKKFKDPNPISIIKVKPNVPFIFRFLLTDYVIDGENAVSAEDKLDLFKKMILDMGIGAKTNVGFGRFSKQKTAENSAVIMESKKGR